MTRLDKDELQLYDLILNRTLASQMKPAQYIRTNVTIINGKSVYKASGNVTKFKGYTAAYEQALGRNQKNAIKHVMSFLFFSRLVARSLHPILSNTEKTKL